MSPLNPLFVGLEMRFASCGENWNRTAMFSCMRMTNATGARREKHLLAMHKQSCTAVSTRQRSLTVNPTRAAA